MSACRHLSHFQNNDEINIMILYYLDWSAAHFSGNKIHIGGANQGDT